MTYLNSRDVAAIAICAALWGVLNSVFAPIFFRAFGLPFLCDLIGFSVLTLAAWWVRKIGVITIIGLVATLINFLFNPGGFHFLGFTAASVLFDGLTKLVGYDNSFKSQINTIASMIPISIISAAFAGYIIGTFFMASPALAKWGGVLGWAGLHAIGGLIGGLIGSALVGGLRARGILPAKISR